MSTWDDNERYWRDPETDHWGYPRRKWVDDPLKGWYEEKNAEITQAVADYIKEHNESLIMKSVIDRFDGHYNFLSNFYPDPVTYGPITYRTAEHAYQTAKFLDSKVRQVIITAKTPGAAKKFGRSFPMRSDWEKVKVKVMEDVLAAKFSNPILREKLLDTGDSELIEGNTWGDRYWGVCGGSGENVLGKLLMKLREHLRAIHRPAPMPELPEPNVKEEVKAEAKESSIYPTTDENGNISSSSSMVPMGDGGSGSGQSA